MSVYYIEEKTAENGGVQKIILVAYFVICLMARADLLPLLL